jgi:hypothetical protein
MKESEQTKQISKPWVVYGVISKFIGRVVEEDSSSVGIQYREGQLFSLRHWNSDYDRFETSDEAIDYLISKNGEYSRRRLIEILLEDFPEAVKKEKLQRAHDLLRYNLSNLDVAQS